MPLSTKAVAVLERRQREYGDSGYVFPDVTQEALKRAFIRTADRAKLEDFRFHDLRHEAASRFFEKGLNVMEAAAVTGAQRPADAEALHPSGCVEARVETRLRLQ